MKFTNKYLLCTLLFSPLPIIAAENPPPKNGLEATLGLAVFSAPKYEGSKDNRAFPVPLVDLNFNWNGLSVGTKGIEWKFLDKPIALGLTIGGDGGRKDKDAKGFLGTGSDYLRGMGEIDATVEYGLSISGEPLGLPINAAIRKAPSGKGHGGTLLDLGAYVPLDLVEGIATGVSIGTTYADKKYNQAYFGVTPAQAGRTNFPVYTPDAGFKSATVGFDASYIVTKNWIASGGVSTSRLLGDAAKSPIVQRKSGTSVSLSFGYKF
jgi:MipA family protein